MWRWLMIRCPWLPSWLWPGRASKISSYIQFTDRANKKSQLVQLLVLFSASDKDAMFVRIQADKLRKVIQKWSTKVVVIIARRPVAQKQVKLSGCTKASSTIQQPTKHCACIYKNYGQSFNLHSITQQTFLVSLWLFLRLYTATTFWNCVCNFVIKQATTSLYLVSSQLLLV